LSGNTHETVAPALAGLSVRDDDGFLDVPVNVEVFPQALVGRVIGQTSNEKLCPCGVLLLRRGAGEGPEALHQLVRGWGPDSAHRAHTETGGTRHQHPPNFGEITAGRDDDLLNLDDLSLVRRSTLIAPQAVQHLGYPLRSASREKCTSVSRTREMRGERER